MLKKTIKFKDLDGNDVTEDFLFHLTKADIAELELSKKGGLSAYAKEIVEAEDGPQLVAIFKDLIARSVGERHEDGRQFVKNQEIRDRFMQSDAYSELFVELATVTDAAIEFFNGIVPANMAEEMTKILANNGKAVTDVALPGDEVPAWITEGRVPTDAELKNATPEQLRIAFERKQNASISEE